MDCSNILNFIKERDRMCDYYCSLYVQGCDYCPFGNMTLPHHCRVVGTIDQEMINLLQGWSDTHQEKN